MASTAARRLVLTLAGGLAAVVLYGCAHRGPGPDIDGGFSPPADSIRGFPLTKSYPREAKGGGFVTVDVAVKPGKVPSWSTPPGSPDTIGWYRNRGEGGKHEKRYDFKSYPDTVYELVLSNDMSGRTKWTIYERHGLVASAFYRSGHLWACDSVPHPPVFFRDIGFKHCGLPVTYDPSELAAISPSPGHFLASYIKPGDIKPDDDALEFLSPAAWISCTTGCCSLGT